MVCQGSFLKNLTVRNWLTFVTSIFECLFAGAVLGWASLAFVLKTEGYFSYLCVNTTKVNATHALDCGAQDQQYSLIFTIASFIYRFLRLPNGFIFDKFGTTVARLIGIILYTAGTLMVAFSTAALALLIFPALSLMALGSSFLIITNVQVGNLFGPRRSTVITLQSGAIGSSSALFLVIKLLHDVGISLLPSFLFLSACSVIHLLRTFFLMPRDRIPYPLPDEYTYGMTCGKSKTVSLEQLTADSNTETKTEEIKEDPMKKVLPPLSEKSFRECLKSRLFWLQLLWLSVIQLRHYYFIGTLNPALQRLTGEDVSLVSRYINAFAIMQMCGVLFAPLNGLIMDRQKSKPRAEGESEREADLRASVLSLFLTALLNELFSVCATIPNLQLQYFTFILQVLSRSFLNGTNAAYISLVSPPRHFGKLYGLISALAAVFSLLQYACFALVNEPLNVDNLYVNIGLTVLSLFAFIQPLSVYLHCRTLASQRAVNQTTNQATNQITNQATNQITNQTTNQTTNQITNETTDQATDQTTDQTTDQATNQTTNQTTNQITNETIDQATDQTTDHATNQTTNQITYQITNETTNETSDEATDQNTDQATNQATDQNTNQTTSQTTNQATSEVADHDT